MHLEMTMRHRSTRAVALLALTVFTGAVAPGGPARAAAERPAQVAQAIGMTCNEKRYSDVGVYLHSSLRSRWVEIGYKVRDYCQTITHGYTLQKVEIRSEEQVGRYSVVDLTYVYSDGARQNDRALFLEEAGAWRLTT
jgi:hypothetical protein